MGRSSGGSHSSGGFGGGHSSGGFSGGGRSHSTRSSSSNSTYYHRSPSRGYYGPRYYGGYRRESSSILTSILALIIFGVIIFMLVVPLFSSQNIPKSTKSRTALSGVVQKTDWYEDRISWVRNRNDLIEGLEDFYNETGVQPYVLLIPYSQDYWQGDSLNYTKADDYLESVYKKKFKDEGHFIFAYFSCRNDIRSEVEGEFRYLTGYAADSIMDSEAISILWGHFEKNYNNLDLSFEEMISNTFSQTADSIMSRSTNGWDVAKIVLPIGGVIVVMIVAYMLFKAKAKREKEKEDYTKEILDKPLETFGEDTSELEEKYK